MLAFCRGVCLWRRGAWVVLLLRGGFPLLLLSWMAGSRQAVWRGFVITLIVVEGDTVGRIGQMGRRAPDIPNLHESAVVCGSLRRANRCGRCLLKLSPEIADGESEVGDLI